MNNKRILSATLVFMVATGLVGCSSKTEGQEKTNQSSVEIVENTELTTETETTTEVPTDIAPKDIIENAKKSLDALDSLETNLYINTGIKSKFAKYLMDDLGYKLEDVPELKDRLDDFFLVETENHIVIKFDEDTVYMSESIKENNEFINLISQEEGTVNENFERYLELNGEQRMFETEGSGWESSVVSDLSTVTANPVQTAIEFLSDFEPDNSDNVKLEDTIVIEGTILAETEKITGYPNFSGRVPAKITFDNINKQLVSIEMDMISVYDDEYLYDLLDPDTIDNAEYISKYIDASKNELIMTFGNANNTDVTIPQEVIDGASKSESGSQIGKVNNAN